MNGSSFYDVVVLGSGFGGSLTAAILGQAGLKVAMIDRQRHPRFSLGESSTPAADFILRDLARRYHLPELSPLTTFGRWRKTYPQLLCGCKRGFSYFWHGEADGFQPTADHRQELFVAANASREAADTQWYRPDLDQFLSDVARNHSVEVFEEAKLIGIEQENGWKLTLDQSGATRRLETEFLIDATGPAGILTRHLKLLDKTARLRTNSFAVAGHWRDLPPFQDWLTEHGAATEDYPFPVNDSAIHHLFRDGWTWQLRFENGLTSLGSVFAAGADSYAEMSSQSLLTHHRPALAKQLSNARLADFPGRLVRTKRLQRLWNIGAGGDWAALPHTIGFIDPLHSTGIAQTLNGIERLVEILLTKSRQDRTPALADYSQRVIDELLLIDLLVAGCYLGLRNFRLFTAWAMLYFAAATSFEMNRLARPGGDVGFLLADDAIFVDLVRGLYQSLLKITDSFNTPTERQIQKFQDQVKSTIAPYNHVGLFTPEIPNMYRYTAAEKPS